MEDDEDRASAVDINQLRSENPNFSWKDLIGLKLTRHSSSNDYNWWKFENLNFFFFSFYFTLDYFFFKKNSTFFALKQHQLYINYLCAEFYYKL